MPRFTNHKFPSLLPAAVGGCFALAAAGLVAQTVSRPRISGPTQATDKATTKAPLAAYKRKRLTISVVDYEPRTKPRSYTDPKLEGPAYWGGSAYMTLTADDIEVLPKGLMADFKITPAQRKKPYVQVFKVQDPGDGRGSTDDYRWRYFYEGQEEGIHKGARVLITFCEETMTLKVSLAQTTDTVQDYVSGDSSRRHGPKDAVYSLHIVLTDHENQTIYFGDVAFRLYADLLQPIHPNYPFETMMQQMDRDLQL